MSLAYLQLCVVVKGKLGQYLFTSNVADIPKNWGVGSELWCEQSHHGFTREGVIGSYIAYYGDVSGFCEKL